MDSEKLILPLSWLGLFLFLLGMGINVHSDSVLRGLRAPGETGYRIPHGGLFSHVSAPNYFGETLEWCGFAAVAQVGLLHFNFGWILNPILSRLKLPSGLPFGISSSLETGRCRLTPGTSTSLEANTRRGGKPSFLGFCDS